MTKWLLKQDRIHSDKDSLGQINLAIFPSLLGTNALYAYERAFHIERLVSGFGTTYQGNKEKRTALTWSRCWKVCSHLVADSLTC